MSEKLGRQIAEARRAHEKSLRALADEVKLSPSYLNDIEHDRRVPSEQAIRDIARVLDLDENAMLAKAGRVGEYTQEYMRSRPSAGVLLRKASDAGLSEEELQKLIPRLDRIIRDRDTQD